MNPEFAGQCLSYVWGAVDPCTPLGVLECSQWVLSERGRDGACLVFVAGYSLAWVLRACGRALRTVAEDGGVSPAQFWPETDPETYYVRRLQSHDTVHSSQHPARGPPQRTCDPVLY